MKPLAYLLLFAGLAMPAWSPQVFAQTIIQVPGVTIDESGIRAGGVTIDQNGVTVNRDAESNGSTVVVGGGRIFGGGNYSRDDFSNQDLAGAVFQSGNFSRANFNGANLTGAIFQGANFSRASFIGACLEGAVFEGVNFSRANFTSAVLTGSTNLGSNFSRAIMDNVDRSLTCGEGLILSTRSQADTGARVGIISAKSIQTSLARGVNSRIDLTVNFELDSDQITGPAHAQLYEISEALKSSLLSANSIMIEGHTDSSGNDSHNMDLSYRRALTVKRVLVEQYEVDGARLQIKGFGESRPVADNETTPGRAINRRVTLVNLG